MWTDQDFFDRAMIAAIPALARRGHRPEDVAELSADIAERAIAERNRRRSGGAASFDPVSLEDE